MAELVEGAPLLRAYTRKTRIVGSNPTLSAIQSGSNWPFLRKSEKGPGFPTVPGYPYSHLPAKRAWSAAIEGATLHLSLMSRIEVRFQSRRSGPRGRK